MEITGRHVALITVGAFSVIIAVNLTLAWNAVATFPGLEVKNSYVASQGFDAERSAQQALGWEVAARLERGDLVLAVTDGASGRPAAVADLEVLVGRPTHVADDVVPAFTFDGTAFRAPVALGPGAWSLRVSATAADGTAFRQRLALTVK